MPTRLADPKLDIDSSLKRDFGVSQTRSISAADGLVRFGRLFAAGPTDFSSRTWNLLELLPLHTAETIELWSIDKNKRDREIELYKVKY